MSVDRINGKDRLIVSQEFAGICSPPGYSESQLECLDEIHRLLVNERSVIDPYFVFTDRGTPLLLELPLGREDQHLVAQVGPVSSFSSSEGGVFVQEQTRNYVDRTTMGNGFPKGNLEVERELLSTFIGGFSPDDLMILVKKIDDESRLKIVGGARIVRGTSDIQVGSTSSYDTYQKHGLHSSLPTFAALRMDLNPEFFEAFVVPESDCVCITRYWRQDDFMLAAMDVDYAATPIDTIALMPVAYTRYYAGIDGGDVPRLAFYDIHKERIARFVRDNFGSVLLANNGQVYPTNEILETILRYHYGGEEFGGYRGKITIGMFETQTFLERAQSYLSRNNDNYRQTYLQVNDAAINLQEFKL
jgi:hypothetical protein